MFVRSLSKTIILDLFYDFKFEISLIIIIKQEMKKKLNVKNLGTVMY